MPKRDTFRVGENKVEIRVAKTIPKPENKIGEFGKLILPSENLAIAQKIIETAKPITKSNPLEVSIEIGTNGKKKTGNNTITIKSDQKEILSKIFDNIFFIFKNFDKSKTSNIYCI